MALDHRIKSLGSSLWERWQTIVAGFFFFLYLIRVINFQYSGRFDSWLMGEWLINYQVGFIRRGLLGELLRSVSLSSGVHITTLAIVLKIGLTIGVVTLLLNLILGKRKRIECLELGLILSPWAFMFEVIDSRGSGRKELFLFFVFLVFLNFLKNRILYRGFAWQFWFLLITFPLLILIHEAFIFYFVFFPLAMLIHSRNEIRSIARISIFPILISIALFSYFYIRGPLTGSEVNVMCKGLTKLSLEISVCDGAIDALKFSIPSIPLAEYTQYYFPSLALTALPIVGFGVFRAPQKWLLTVFMAVVGLLMIIPLLYVSYDWGRWIHIYGVMLFSTYFTFEDTQESPTQISVMFNKKWGRWLLVGLMIIYITSWRLRPFIGNSTEIDRMFFDLQRWVKALIGI